MNMQEQTLRKWHRRIALVFALFIMVQALSGFFLDATWFSFPHDFIGRTGPLPGLKWDNINAYWQRMILYAHYVHLGGLISGVVYRAILTLGIITTALSGLLIYYDIRKREKK
jgi:membrane associated rhomboid family serine protease